MAPFLSEVESVKAIRLLLWLVVGAQNAQNELCCGSEFMICEELQSCDESKYNMSQIREVTPCLASKFQYE